MRKRIFSALLCFLVMQQSYGQLSLPSVFVSFTLDGYLLGDVVTFPNEAQLIESEVDYRAFFDLLEPLILPDQLKKLNAYVKNGRLKLRDFPVAGIAAVFDLNKLEVELVIPLALRKVQDLALGYHPKASSRALLLKPAFASGAFNVLVNKPFNQTEESSAPLNTTLNSFANLGGVVFEDVRSYTDGAEIPWVRSESRIVIDQVSKKNRYSFGDLRYLTTGFQAYSPMAGVSITRDFSLDPNSSVTTYSRTSFELRQAATVEILINGASYRTLQLSAGRYNLSELPITTGFNDIDLIVTDQLGHKERLNFPYVYSSELLSPGVGKFSYNLGYPSTPKQGDLEYNQNNPLFSGFHRMGISAKWTAGIYYQNDNNRSLLGLESFVGDTWGTLNYDIASSNIPVYGLDFASRVRYRSWNYINAPIQFWGAGIDFFGPKFSNFALSPNNLMKSNIDFFVNPLISDSWQTTVGISYKLMRLPELNSESLYLRGSRVLSEGVSFSSDASVTYVSPLAPEWKIGINFIWSDVPKKMNHILSYSSTEFTKRYDMQKTFHSNAINLGLADKEHEQNASVRFAHVGRRYNFSTDFNHNRFKNSDTQVDSQVNQSGNINLASSLVWTSNGGITLMSPVNDSFAIFDLGEGLEREIIEMNRSGSGASATSEYWSSLAVNDLVGYQDRNVYLESANDLGIKELKENEFVLRPYYKSGIYKKISLLSNFVARGKVISSKQKPVALKFGEAVADSGNVDSDNKTDGDSKAEQDSKVYRENKLEKSYSFFTNRKGEFEIERLVPGNYRLYFEGFRNFCIISIPKAAEGFYELDTCYLEKEE